MSYSPDNPRPRVMVKEISKRDETEAMMLSRWPRGAVVAMSISTQNDESLVLSRPRVRVVYCASWPLLKDWLSEDMENRLDRFNLTSVSICVKYPSSRPSPRKRVFAAVFRGYDSLELSTFFKRIERIDSTGVCK